ncbi:MAG: DNA-binding protein [Parabacteroides sp.]|nr:DNA-binding protein [Parabacteroides sp.]
MGEDKAEVPEKKYAQIVSGDFIAFPELIEEVSDSSGVGSAGVKAVLDRLNVVLVRHLQHGRRVSVGELGTFRFTIGSTGVIDEKSFDTSLIREPKIRFFPGKALRTIKSQASFEKLVEKKEDEKGGDEDDDRPVIE